MTDVTLAIENTDEDDEDDEDDEVKLQNPLKYSKNLVNSPVSRHFPYSKVSRNRRNDKIPGNHNFSMDFVISPVYRHFQSLVYE